MKNCIFFTSDKRIGFLCEISYLCRAHFGFFSMSGVSTAMHKMKGHLYRLLKLFCKLLLEGEYTWWTTGHTELVKNQKLLSLFQPFELQIAEHGQNR